MARAFLQTGLPLLLVVMVLWFVDHAMGRGLSLWSAAEQASSRLFHPGSALANTAIYAHMALGGLITGLAPLQLIPAIRRKWPRVHHVLGYSVAGLAAMTALGGLIYLARHGAIGGAPMIAGFGLYGALMLLAAVRTLQLAHTRDPRHYEWGARLIMLIMGSYLYRMHYGLNYALFGGVATNDAFTGTFDLVQNVAFYVPYLLILEIWLRRRRGRMLKKQAV